MIKLSTLFWLLVVAAAGFAMFAVKYQVQDVADRLARTAKAVDDATRDVRVLDAEWAYLNRPDALAQMNQRFLALAPIATKQLRSSVADLPMRPAPPPPPPPPAAPQVVAAAPEAAAPAGAATPPPAPAMVVAAAQTPDLSAQAETPSSRPHEQSHPSAARLHGASAARDTREAARSARPAVVRTAARASLQHRAASLDELIAEIADNRQ